MSCQRRARTTWLGALIVPALLVATSAVAAAAGGGVSAKPAGGSASGTAACGPVPVLDATTFPGIPAITNTFQPMVPGTQFLLDGVVVDKSGTRHPHRIQTTVTDLTKVLDGVRTVVIHEQDIQDGQLQESELYFVSQDRNAAIWTFGEYPEEYSGGKLTGAPASWLSGVTGAHAGIAMQGNPQAGTPVYRQGFAPSVGFEDCASVFQTGQHVCNGTTCYDNVLVTDEFAPNAQSSGHQRKYYAPGIGTVKVGAASGVDPETLTLTQASKLCAAAFSQIRQQAVDQDGRSSSVAKSVYSGTPAAAQTLTAQLGC
jgi:hypothetical protein